MLKVVGKNNNSFTLRNLVQYMYLRTSPKRPLKKKTINGFQDLLSLNAGQKYCRLLSWIVSTSAKLPLVIKTLLLSIFE